MTRIVFEPLHEGVEPPARATAGSAGYDLRAYLVRRTLTCSDGTTQWTVETGEGKDAAVALQPGQMVLVPLGFRARLPEGFEAQVRPRSGASFKRGIVIPNAPGTIDADYPDEWMVPVRNGTQVPMRIEHGERIAQVILARYEVMDWAEGQVARTTDRAGGFGSTGH
ncbi:MAG TPA: dUTP diphosphatase [Gemmatimonadaceae bacterium]|nr:dUTP diphosphatase [Gemmatimonadaceae bacterium]